MRRAHKLAKHIAAIERGIVLTGHYFDLCGINPAGNLFEQLVALGVLVGSIGVVGEIAGDDYQLGPPLKRVDTCDGAFERPGPERIGRSIKTNMGVTELDERKRRGRLAV